MIPVASNAAGEIRRPFFFTAVALTAVVVLVEVGLGSLVGGGSGGSLSPADAQAAGVPAGVVTPGSIPTELPSGAGIKHLALVDGLLLFTLVLIGSSLLISQRAYGRVQGLVTFVVTLLWIIGSLVLAGLALATLLLMIGLFVAVPFGTIAYLVVWGFFPVRDTAMVLALLLLLKLLFMAALVIAQPAFLKVKGLVVLVVVSLVLQLGLGLVQQLLPTVVVSIGDEFWALITAVVAVVWAIVMLVGAIPAMVNAVRAARSTTPGG